MTFLRQSYRQNGTGVNRSAEHRSAMEVKADEQCSALRGLTLPVFSVGLPGNAQLPPTTADDVFDRQSEGVDHFGCAGRWVFVGRWRGVAPAWFRRRKRYQCAFEGDSAGRL